MKRYLFSIVLLVVSAGTALPQSGVVCLFSDVDGTQCSFEDASPGLIQFHVIHAQTTAATAVQFAAPLPSCMTGATYIADTAVFPVTIGNSQGGVSIAYGSCLSGPIRVLTIAVLGQGQTGNDCGYAITPLPADATIKMVDCSNHQLPASGGIAYINSSLACQCEAVPVPPMLDISPTGLFFGLDLTSLDFQIANGGGGTLSWSAEASEEWISINPASGGGPTTVTVTVDRTGLSAGSHAGQVTVTSNGGTAGVAVFLSAPGVGPILSVEPTYLFFPQNVTVETFDVSNAGDGTLNWSVSENVPWVELRVISTTTQETVEVTVDRTGLAAGTYTGSVDVVSNGGNETVTVEMVVPAQIPVLGFSPASLSFGMDTSRLFFDIMNEGTGVLSWSITPSEPWVSVDPVSGTNDETVTVDIDRAGLAPGAYAAHLVITSNGGNDSVTVEMVVPAQIPVLGFSPASLSFGPGLSQLSLGITNQGTGTLSWSITPSEPWVSVNPVSGMEDGTIIVDVDRTGLSDGSYAANLAVTSNGGNGMVPIMMTVSTMPILVVNPTLLVFSQLTTQRTFNISNGGVGTLDWSLSADAPWIIIQSALSGSGNATVPVRVDLGALPPGQQTGHIEVTSTGGDATVTIRFNTVSTYPGYLQLSGDPYGTQCDINDPAPGLLRIYVVHAATPGVTASSFAAPFPPCMTGVTYLADETVFGVNIGNSQTGVSVGYGLCLGGPIHVLTMLFFGTGLSSRCCTYPIIPNPIGSTGQIEAVDCGSNLHTIAGITAVVNPDATCYCGQLAVEQSSWGRIKSLYSSEGR